MTASKRDEGSRARRRIDDALEILRRSLAEHLARQPARDATLDLPGLLSVFIEGFPDSGLPRRARTLAHGARDARNEVAHFTGTMTPALGLHHLSAVRQLLVDLGADAAVAELNPIYRAQIAELAGQHPAGGTTPGPAPSETPATAASRPRPGESPKRPRAPTPGKPPAHAPPSAPRRVGSQADDIRRFVRDYSVVPAARSSRRTVTVRAADVATLMGLERRIPNIVNALGGRKFESFANVLAEGRAGSDVGADTVFTFAVLDAPSVARAADGPGSPASSPRTSNGVPDSPDRSGPRQRPDPGPPRVDNAAERAGPAPSHAAAPAGVPSRREAAGQPAKLRYERRVSERRDTISRLFAAIERFRGPFTLTALHRSMQRPGERHPMTLTVLVKYARILSSAAPSASSPARTTSCSANAECPSPMRYTPSRTSSCATSSPSRSASSEQLRRPPTPRSSPPSSDSSPTPPTTFPTPTACSLGHASRRDGQAAAPHPTERRRRRGFAPRFGDDDE